MKKIGSVLLAALLVALSLVPAFAAGGTCTYRFIAPSSEVDEDAYAFYRSEDGEFADYEENADGGYVYYPPYDQYYFLDDLADSSRKIFTEAEPGSPESKRYVPVPYQDGTVQITDPPQVITFIVVTSEKYDASTVIVKCNGELLPKNDKGEYAVVADRDLVFNVEEFNENHEQLLLRNHYLVTLPSGDGYSAKPPIGQNNKVAYYGEDYEFRVKITKGYDGSNMKVKVLRGSNFLAEYIGEEADMLSTVMGEAETLSSTGVDQDGYRTYKIKNVTSECKIQISGVQKGSTSGVLAMLKRILRLLLGLLGINLDDLLGEDLNPLSAYTITMNEEIDPTNGVTYIASPEFKHNSATGNFEAEVLSGECIYIKVTVPNESWTDPDRHIVTWKKASEPDKLYGTDYENTWKAIYDLNTGNTTWTSEWYIDGIASNVDIFVTASD